MKTVSKFETIDGKLFESAEKAQRHEEVLGRMDAVDRLLPSAIDDSCRFANGGGYIQQKEDAVMRFFSALAELIEFAHSKEWADKFRQNPRGIVGRYIDDSDSPLWKIMRRVYCLDMQNREWGQPFYAMNPEQGTRVEWPHVSALQS